MDNKVDIKENYIYHLDNQLLKILLKDHSSKNNIIWATDNYASKGEGYCFKDYITIKNITGRNGLVIKPRTKKSQREQIKRIKEKAEVFTPSWVCNEQNNLIDNNWFQQENVFNTPQNKTWITNTNKIPFPQNKNWIDYVSENRLEISCGEAPYLISRYDTVTGEWIKIEDRIGLLDRKLRVINENTVNLEDWFNWCLIAYKSIYGFEWQGDSLLIARENMLFTFMDYYVERFGEMPPIEKTIEIAKIISWNLWQMDGLKFVIPESCKPEIKNQLSLFDNDVTNHCRGCEINNNKLHIGIYAIIKDWKTKKTKRFIDMIKEK